MNESHDDIITPCSFPITRHALDQLAERWPHTVLRPKSFDTVHVPRDATLIGYDSATSAMIVDVPETPMSAFIAGGVVVTFLTRDAARAKIALHGYGLADFGTDGTSTNTNKS